MKTIKLKPKKEESILRHHPWVFSGAIATIPNHLEAVSYKNIRAN
ncbi:MAG: hypothetical protein K2J78_06605, partial [Muribaculaceae bacterium]|nr:hypothetical protein [Muribaculaceae bacterium]